jgi:hypothetical protein
MGVFWGNGERQAKQNDDAKTASKCCSDALLHNAPPCLYGYGNMIYGYNLVNTFSASVP